MATMDLQCRLDHREPSWRQEESVLLERFDAERKEWESQLRDMQKNIEELYNEVKARREGNTTGLDGRNQDNALKFDVHSDNTNLPPGSLGHHSNGYSEPPHQGSNGYSDPPDRHGNKGSFVRPDHCVNGGYNGGYSNGYSHPVNHLSNGYGHPADCDSQNSRDSVEAELEDILYNCLSQGPEYVSSTTGQNASIRPLNGCHNIEYGQLHPTGKETRKNTTAVNSALKEIARVSEDLSSYQDVIRKRSGSESPWFEELENQSHSGREWSDSIQTPSEQESRMNWENTNRSSNKADTGARPCSRNKEAPPIPPRTTSWYLNSSPAPEPQVLVQESFTDRKCPSPCVITDRKCPSPCVITDRKCTSPSVLRKFGAMLQENEGKTFIDSGVLTNIVPADSKCNIGSYHGKFGGSKSSTHVPVQKCLSDVGMLADIDYGKDCRPADSPKLPRGQFQPVDREFVGKNTPVDFRGSPLPDPKGPWRNQTVTQKGIGHGLEEEMGVTGRPKSVNLYPAVQYVENGVGGRPVGSGRGTGVQVLNENAVHRLQPADSRSNYSVEETPLRGYESCNGSQQHQKCHLYGSGREDDLIELLGMLGIEHQPDSRQRPLHTPCQQETAQESQQSSGSSKKGFSRPARPANRRPPSRWANRKAPSPITPVTRPPDPAQKPFICPYSCYIETVIM